MPSTVVHLAFAVLLAAALLGDAFDRRALGVIFAVTVFPDLDAFLGLVVRGAHRAAFHTVLIPAFAAGVVLYDTQVRDRDDSWLRRVWGQRGPRLAWTVVAVYLVSAIGLDLFTNGVNVLYPVHDQFYSVGGRLFLSSQRGVVQTFVEFSQSGGMGSTETVHYRTGVDPSPGAEEKNVERIFPVVWSGWQLLLVTAGVLTLFVRARWTPRR